MFSLIITSSKAGALNLQLRLQIRCACGDKGNEECACHCAVLQQVHTSNKKMKDQQKESSLAKYSGQPKNILQDVKTRWWSTYRMLKRLRFLREAISHYVVDNPHDSDLVNLTHEEWRLCHQVEITLQTMAFWQRANP
jgi:hypothetical protein